MSELRKAARELEEEAAEREALAREQEYQGYQEYEEYEEYEEY